MAVLDGYVQVCHISFNNSYVFSGEGSCVISVVWQASYSEVFVELSHVMLVDVVG